MASWGTYIQAFVYIALLFFFIPIRINGPDEVEGQFEEYLKQFNKSYDDPQVYQTRLEAFKQSLETINLLNNNKTNGSANYGLTKFSDLLPEEFTTNHLKLNLSQRLFKHSKHHEKVNFREQRSTFPQKIDWRDKNVVTEINDQGSCGACWAYSVVETVESMNAIKSNKTETFSVQEVIDCAGNNAGCGGGDICSLLTWLKDTNYTLHTKGDYKKAPHCKSNQNGVQIEGFICDSFVGIEDIMLRLLAENGPLAVAINAQTWQNYIGGVIRYHCDGNPLKLNHAVQIVGYDLTADIPHYIVRNTWGPDFGENGYLYIAIDENMCGLANEVSALTVL